MLANRRYREAVMTSAGMPIGIAWYHRKDYKRLMKIFADSQELPSTFDEWLQLAYQTYDRLKRQGHLVEKVYIDPDTFPAWCAKRGLNINANARASFADEFVRQKHCG